MVSYDIAASTTMALHRRRVLTGGAAMLGTAWLAGCGHRSAGPATLRVALIDARFNSVIEEA
jgi:hypothetical protein